MQLENNNSMLNKVKRQNEQLKKQVKALESKLFLAKGCIDYSDADLAIQAAQILKYKEELAAKHKQIEQLTETVSRLLSMQ